MLRVLFNRDDEPTWVLTEDELLSRIDQLAANGFAQAPAGPVAVEGVDERDRVKWRGLYPNAAALTTLAREIREGRKAAARRRA